jgi:hypothetical protein
VNDPLVFSQYPFVVSQPWFPLHSFISERNETKDVMPFNAESQPLTQSCSFDYWPLLCIPIHAGITSMVVLLPPWTHAHFATLPPMVSMISRQRPRWNKVANWNTRSGGQPPIWLELSITKVTLPLAPNSKQATPTAFDPCPQADVPTMHFPDTCRPPVKPISLTGLFESRKLEVPAVTVCGVLEFSEN